MTRRSALANSRQLKIPQGISRRSRRPEIPETSVTGWLARSSSSAGRSSTALAPNGLAESEISFARGLRPGDPDRRRVFPVTPGLPYDTRQGGLRCRS